MRFGAIVQSRTLHLLFTPVNIVGILINILYRNVLIGIKVIYMETKGGFYITQIKQLQDRIFERLLLENGIEISGGQ